MQDIKDTNPFIHAEFSWYLVNQKMFKVTNLFTTFVDAIMKLQHQKYFFVYLKLNLQHNPSQQNNMAFIEDNQKCSIFMPFERTRATIKSINV